MIPLYAKLCSRDEPLNKTESQKLGVETVVLVFHARERLRSSSRDGVKSPLPEGVNPLDVMQVVSEMWQGDDVSNRSSGGWVVVNSFCCTFTYSFRCLLSRIGCRLCSANLFLDGPGEQIHG